MSEPFLDRLSRFTPAAGSLDRDALLFAAGRASARLNRGWITLAAVLASTQALSLALLWPHPVRPAGGLSVSVARAPAPVERTMPERFAHPGVWSAGSTMEELETEDRPAEAVTLIESEPPWRAFAPPPASILN